MDGAGHDGAGLHAVCTLHEFELHDALGVDGSASVDVGLTDSPSDGPITDASATSYFGVVVDDTPLAYWRLGDSTPPAKDERGRFPGHYVGPLRLGALGAIANDVNTAVAFKRDNQMVVSSASAFDFVGTVPFSLECWVSASGADRGILDHIALSDGSISGGWCLYYRLTPNSPTAEIAFHRGTSAEVKGMVSLGAYHHVVATYDGAILLLYVDGLVVAGKMDTEKLVSTGRALRVGVTSSIGYFDGALDELALYEKALSPQRVKAHYDAAQPN